MNRTPKKHSIIRVIKRRAFKRPFPNLGKLALGILAAMTFATSSHALFGKASDRERALQLYSLSEKGSAILIDVREADEIRPGIVKGSRWLPTSKMDETHPAWKTFISQLPSGEHKAKTPIGVYCRSGNRAKRLIEKLRSMGYSTENLGGFSDLKSYGIPVTTPEL